jgi:hypothetical protein
MFTPLVVDPVCPLIIILGRSGKGAVAEEPGLVAEMKKRFLPEVDLAEAPAYMANVMCTCEGILSTVHNSGFNLQ